MNNMTITKQEAEQFFKLSGFYGKEELAIAYHKKIDEISSNAVDSSRRTEDGIDNLKSVAESANKVLLALLQNAPDGRIHSSYNPFDDVDDVFEELSDAARRRREEKESSEERRDREETQNRWERQKESENANAKAAEERRRKSRDVSYRQRVRKVPAGHYVDEDGFIRVAYTEEYYWEAYYLEDGWQPIGEMLGGRTSCQAESERLRKAGAVPDVLTRKYKKVENAHYRFRLAGINAMIGIVLFAIWTWHSQLLGSPILALITIVVALAAVADLITGCFTRPFKNARIKALDRQLLEWRKSHSEEIQGD